MSGATPGADGRLRCPWGNSADDYVAYHDEEWGVPLHGEAALYERLIAGGVPVRPVLADDPAQAGGLPPRVRRLRAQAGGGVRRRGRDPADGRRLDRAQPRQDRRRDPQRPRDRGPGPAAGRAAVVLRPGRAAPPQAAWRTSPPITPESKAMAKELKKRGFAFVGPTTAYALMQATGMVDDHVDGLLARRPSGPASGGAGDDRRGQLAELLLGRVAGDQHDRRRPAPPPTPTSSRRDGWVATTTSRRRTRSPAALRGGTGLRRQHVRGRPAGLAELHVPPARRQPADPDDHVGRGAGPTAVVDDEFACHDEGRPARARGTRPTRPPAPSLADASTVGAEDGSTDGPPGSNEHAPRTPRPARR